MAAHQKEKTSRDRALEFAKSIPKPKVKGVDNMQMQSSETDLSMSMNEVIEEDHYDEYGNTLKS